MEHVAADKIGGHVFRIKVPGGWIITVENEANVGISFYPDANHEWRLS